MQIKKLIIAYFMVLIACLMPVSQASAQSDPVRLLQTIADNMIAGLREHKATLKSNREVVYSLAYRYVVPYADLDAMSQRVLPPSAWKQATEAQRAAFKKEFTKLLIRTYASALTNYKDQTVKFYPARGGSGNNVEVSSDIISSQSSPIHVTYRLLRVGGEWRLYDMSVEGVSLIESFRAQFGSILASGNMDELISRMSGHNNR